MPEVSGKLDFSPAPGDSSRTRWEQRVNYALSQNHEFTCVGKEGKATLWQLNKAHIPAEPASKAFQRENGKFMAKGNSMGQGGH